MRTSGRASWWVVIVCLLAVGCGARRSVTRVEPAYSPVAATAAAAPQSATSPESTAWIQGLTRVPRERMLPIHPSELTYSDMIANGASWSGQVLMMQVRSEDVVSQLVDEGQGVYYLHVLPVTRGNPNNRPVLFRFADPTWIMRRASGEVSLPCQPGNCPQTTIVARVTSEQLVRVIDQAGNTAPLPVLEVLGVADRVDFWESPEMTRDFPAQ